MYPGMRLLRIYSKPPGQGLQNALRCNRGDGVVIDVPEIWI